MNATPETAPSALAADATSTARVVGLMGMMLAAMGFTIVVASSAMGPRLLSIGWGYMLLALGLVGMLYHAVRDGDMLLRRAYGNLGYAFIALAAVLSIVEGRYFLGYGSACLLTALCFLLALSRHETDAGWCKRLTATFGAIGGLLAIAAFGTAIFAPSFVPTYALALALLGLFYLTAIASQADPLTNIGFRAGQAILALGSVMLLYAVLRAALPNLFGWRVEPFLMPTGFLLAGFGVLYMLIGFGIVSDAPLVVMTKRELIAYFCSPVAYVLMLGIALVGAFSYNLFIGYLDRGQFRFEPIVGYYLGMFPPFVVIFLIPAVTMRLLAEEKKSGTYEVLLCAPVREVTVVLSKWLAAIAFFMILWVIWSVFLLGLRVENGEEFDYRPLLSYYLTVLFTGAAFLAMGLFFSSLSKNQIIAAMLTFLGMLMLVSFGFLQQVEFVGKLWQNVFRQLSFMDLWQQALSGRLAVRSIVLQASVSAFWLFLTVKVLESRKWS